MKVKVYVDGSFNEQRQVYGGGIVIIVPNLDQPIFTKVVGNDPILLPSRNIAGELLATMEAMKLVDKLDGVTEIEIYHDYLGIAYWLTGAWQAKKPVSIKYRQHMTPYKEKYNITFTHVKGHSGDYYNGMADRLAREGTFLPLGG